MTTAFKPANWIRIQNDSGMLIPPRSVVVVTSVTTDPIAVDPTYPYESIDTHHVQQYNGQAGNVFVTGAVAIASGQLGVAYTDQFIYVAIDTGVAIPVSGEMWGPASGTWTITRGGWGFVAEGYSSTGSVPDKSMFYRTFPPRELWAKIISTLQAGAFGCPTTCLCNVWVKNTSSMSVPQPLIASSDTGLQGLTLVSRDGTSAIIGQCARIEWDFANAEWVPVRIFNDRSCSSSVSSVSSSVSSSQSSVSSVSSSKSSSPSSSVSSVSSTSSASSVTSSGTSSSGSGCPSVTVVTSVTQSGCSVSGTTATLSIVNGCLVAT